MKKSLFVRIILPLLVLTAAALGSLTAGAGSVEWANWQQDAIFELRFIRLLAAFTVGGSLALAGLIFQAVLRNVLAEPFTLGISGGASVGAALAVILDLQLVFQQAVPLMAWCGAVVMLILVLLMAGKRGGENLLLSGVIAGTCASALLMYLVSVADKDDLAGITWWMLGDLQTVEIKLLIPALAVLTLFTAGARFFGRELNAVAMGDLEAWSMGVNCRVWKLIFIAAGSFLAAQTVAMAGLIAFAGLIVPHLVRGFYGCDHRYTAVTTALWGGVFLVIADTLARLVHPAHELPVGVLTSLLGGGLFIYLINRKRGKLL